jgi:uncharacterized protein
VASSTVRGYYEILEDTLVGAMVPAFTRRAKRRVHHAPKFYFRDVGVVNHLVGRRGVAVGTETFGTAFENWVFHEISYWRLSSGIEVDFVFGDAETAIKVKGKSRLHSRDTRHLEEFRREHPKVGRRIVVCAEPRPSVPAHTIWDGSRFRRRFRACG